MGSGCTIVNISCVDNKTIKQGTSIQIEPCIKNIRKENISSIELFPKNADQDINPLYSPNKKLLKVKFNNNPKKFENSMYQTALKSKTPKSIYNIQFQSFSPKNAVINYFPSCYKSEFNQTETNKYMSDNLDNIPGFEQNNNYRDELIAKEMIEYINKIRNRPKYIISDIENFIFKRIKIFDGEKFILCEETKEKIVIKDKDYSFDECITFLRKQKPMSSGLMINDELKIDFNNCNTSMSNVLNLSETKTNYIILNKRKEILYKYPNCFFTLSLIKDSKLCLLFLLSDNKSKNTLREIIFSEKYKYFNISCTNEKNNNFIGILCFA